MHVPTRSSPALPFLGAATAAAFGGAAAAVAAVAESVACAAGRVPGRTS